MAAGLSFLALVLGWDPFFVSAFNFFFFLSQSKSKLLSKVRGESRTVSYGLEMGEMAHFMNKYLPAVLCSADSNKD